MTKSGTSDLSFTLRWRTYITKEALSTTKHVKLVGKKEFVAAALDLESEIFIVYVVSLSFIALPGFFPLKLDVHPFHRLQVSGLIAKKASIKISAKYSDFPNIFFPDWVFKLPEHTKINNYAIKLVNG